MPRLGASRVLHRRARCGHCNINQIKIFFISIYIAMLRLNIYVNFEGITTHMDCLWVGKKFLQVKTKSKSTVHNHYNLQIMQCSI